eukprot:10634891-Alexandrium_andersonii.AAC.1
MCSPPYEDGARCGQPPLHRRSLGVVASYQDHGSVSVAPRMEPIHRLYSALAPGHFLEGLRDFAR